MSSLFVGNTDRAWFDFLSLHDDLDAINFWQPGGQHVFKSLAPGELFLFRLKSPVNKIAGGGWFEKADRIPISAAWQIFQHANGVPTAEALITAIERYRGRPIESPHLDEIGCIVLGSPFFLAPEDWVALPPDWPMNAVKGKRYETDSLAGRVLLESVLAKPSFKAASQISDEHGVYRVERGVVPTLGMRRIGQQAFRVMVLEAYERRCALTDGKVLPVLEAAHIQPFGQGGEHDITNGILMRTDVHALFDLGYLTVAPDLTVRASRRLKDDFDNGNDYRRLHGNTIWVPSSEKRRPNPQLLEWHADTVFKG